MMLSTEICCEKCNTTLIRCKFMLRLRKDLTNEQNLAYNTVTEHVRTGNGGLLFLDAPGGTGKTFLLNLILAEIRMKHEIALAVASSGIAATLLDGGRTAHSAFKLPLNLNIADVPLCNIGKTSGMATVLKTCQIIIWDECTMAHKKALEALDRTLRDFRGNQRLMGGALILLAGDFRQILPVIPRATPADELNACLKNSALWRHVKKITLSTNMRVHLHGDVSAQTFAKQLLNMGDGKIPVDPATHEISFPPNFCQLQASIGDLEKVVFPDIATNFKNHDWLCERAILAPKNDEVNRINHKIQLKIPGAVTQYKSIDTVTEEDQAVNYPVEFLNSLEPPGMPPHVLSRSMSGSPGTVLWDHPHGHTPKDYLPHLPLAADVTRPSRDLVTSLEIHRTIREQLVILGQLMTLMEDGDIAEWGRHESLRTNSDNQLTAVAYSLDYKPTLLQAQNPMDIFKEMACYMSSPLTRKCHESLSDGGRPAQQPGDDQTIDEPVNPHRHQQPQPSTEKKTQIPSPIKTGMKLASVTPMVRLPSSVVYLFLLELPSRPASVSCCPSAGIPSRTTTTTAQGVVHNEFLPQGRTDSHSLYGRKRFATDYLQNRIPSKATDKTPFELGNRKPRDEKAKFWNSPASSRPEEVSGYSGVLLFFPVENYHSTKTAQSSNHIQPTTQFARIDIESTAIHKRRGSFRGRNRTHTHPAEVLLQVTALLAELRLTQHAEVDIPSFDGTYAARQFFQAYDREMDRALVTTPKSCSGEANLLDLYPESNEASKHFALKLAGQASLEEYYRREDSAGHATGVVPTGATDQRNQKHQLRVTTRNSRPTCRAHTPAHQGKQVRGLHLQRRRTANSAAAHHWLSECRHKSAPHVSARQCAPPNIHHRAKPKPPETPQPFVSQTSPSLRAISLPHLESLKLTIDHNGPS
ncbi:hypothetical protein LAZ67_9002987 [Cordylochernes scorpioides]|uniref:ATP-dependent DNA helicase n=1 Tax=Cordylochernes scorpioides TaxID=51811 RepID=A0ABY6KUP0_9ARAC|nr:hypothetical protein LAZ67_9002987 [Cordylochernes scorpioides]